MLFVKHNKKFIYIIQGGKIFSKVFGIAILEEQSRTSKIVSKREFDGPVMGRDKFNPIFAAATSVHVDKEGKWKSWYNSGISWEKRRRLASNMAYIMLLQMMVLIGVTGPGLIIPIKDEYEHSFGRPSVVKWDGRYQMWFA